MALRWRKYFLFCGFLYNIAYFSLFSLYFLIFSPLFFSSFFFPAFKILGGRGNCPSKSGEGAAALFVPHPESPEYAHDMTPSLMIQTLSSEESEESESLRYNRNGNQDDLSQSLCTLGDFCNISWFSVFFLLIVISHRFSILLTTHFDFYLYEWQRSYETNGQDFPHVPMSKIVELGRTDKESGLAFKMASLTNLGKL